MKHLVILDRPFVAVALRSIVYALLALARTRGIGRRRAGGEPAAGRGFWPKPAERRSADRRNPFERPLLFAALTGVDLLRFLLAWLDPVFVTTRTAHTAIDLGSATLGWRSPAFPFELLASLGLKPFVGALLGGLA